MEHADIVSIEEDIAIARRNEEIAIAELERVDAHISEIHEEAKALKAKVEAQIEALKASGESSEYLQMLERMMEQFKSSFNF